MRTCEANDTCVSPVFGTDKNTGIGYCKLHQYLRTDLKSNSKNGLVKRSQKKHTREISFGFESQPALFAWLWDDAKNEKGEIICKYTGEKLNKFANSGLTIFLTCFAHVLPKSKYTYFKLYPKNVRVVFPEFHRIVDQGTYIDRVNHPNWKFELWDRESEELKIQYTIFKKQNLLP
jgi:hypothetical protein